METLCFLCSKKIGPFREQYSIKDFQDEKLSPPPNFTDPPLGLCSAFPGGAIKDD